MVGIIQKEMFLDYHGPLNFQINRGLTHLLRDKIREFSDNVLIQKRCSYLFEELMSNVYQYYKRNALNGELVTASMALIDSNQIEVNVSNTVMKKDIPSLITLIKSVNEGTEKSLREKMAKNIILSQQNYPACGLGLITVKLKTGCNFLAVFTKKNTEQEIFSLTTTLSI